ncbi:uncharacterized protein LOC114541188 [Dendronephthya gigantea]|nr:uncharacterized protein LOC114541188 [Dendronephthya gigantea]
MLLYVFIFSPKEPTRILLGHVSKRRRVGTGYNEVLANEEFAYVPLLESLEQLLNQPSVLIQVLNGHASTDGYMRDFCDGQLYRCHPLLLRNPQAIQIILYYDELEIVNPLGSKTGKHKLGAFYYTLANIHPEHRSQLQAIQLVALVTVPLVKKYGIDAILEPFMNDLKELEKDEGHGFKIDGRIQRLQGTIV